MKDYNDFLFLNNGLTKDWFCEYKDKLGVQIFHDQRGRWPTMKMALNLFLQNGGGTIVETGCQRELDDWGAGASTSIFAKVLEHYKSGHLYSIDNNSEHICRAATFIQEYADYVDLILDDSINGLNTLNKSIELLYLDSFDYPIEELAKPYGGFDHWNEALLALERMTEQEVLNQFGNDLLPSQEHCLKELLAAEPHLHSGSVLLIDDNTLPGGGKGRLTREYLLDKRWLLLLDYHQSLWYLP